MCYDGALVMPSSYAVMNEEEMMYLEGGYAIQQSIMFLNKTFVKMYALSLKTINGWNNISIYDLAAEIYSHALAYYSGGWLLKIAAGLGASKAANYLKSLKVIDVENGRDSRYWKQFNIIYALL